MSIGPGLEKLTGLTRIEMYGSKLQRLPRHSSVHGSAMTTVDRSIGKLEELLYLNLYTSYTLHYLPYEVCAHIHNESPCFSAPNATESGARVR